MDRNDIALSYQSRSDGSTWMELVHTPSGLSVEGRTTGSFDELQTQLLEQLTRLVDDAANDD